MFEAKVYTTAILSLSGMMDETHTARETVSRFNQRHAASTGRLFLPVDDPQAADVVIGIVDNWVIDTAWVDDCIRQGKHVTLLFSAFQDPNNTIPCEHSEVEAFRKSLQCACAYVLYWAMEDGHTLPAAGALYQSDKLSPADCQRVSAVLQKIAREGRIVADGEQYRKGEN